MNLRMNAILEERVRQHRIDQSFVSTLYPVWDRWDDPGEYPSGAGGSPLPSYSYIAEWAGNVRFPIRRELRQYAEEENIPLAEVLNAELNERQGAFSCADFPQFTKWEVEIDGDTCIGTPSDWI